MKTSSPLTTKLSIPAVWPGVCSAPICRPAGLEHQLAGLDRAVDVRAAARPRAGGRGSRRRSAPCRRGSRPRGRVVVGEQQVRRRVRSLRSIASSSGSDGPPESITTAVPPGSSRHEVGVRQPVGLHGAFDDLQPWRATAPSIRRHGRRRAAERSSPCSSAAAYLNTGSVGPVPRAAAEAAAARLARLQLEQGRGGQGARSSSATATAEVLRARVAAPARLRPAARSRLTGATTDGVNAVLGGLDLEPRRRGADHRRGAPRAAGAAGLRARGGAASTCASCRSPKSPSEVGPRPGWSPARTCRGSTGGCVDVEALARAGARYCSTARRGSARAGRRARARLRLLRGVGPEVALRPGRQRLPLRARGR